MIYTLQLKLITVKFIIWKSCAIFFYITYIVATYLVATIAFSTGSRTFAL